MSKYLLEIGTEELPYKFIDAGQEQLKAAFEKLLKENEIGFSSVKTYGTPRRLTVIIDGLNEKQPDTVKTVRGPIANIAFDENGNLTQAGLGFARKNGVEPSALYKEDNYVHAKIEKKGKLTRDVLAENIENLVLKMQEIYEQLYGKKPAVMAVHAGLECGILGSKYTHWDMISFGPTICSPHSPDERVNIASVGKFWEYLKATLKNIPAK